MTQNEILQAIIDGVGIEKCYDNDWILCPVDTTIARCLLPEYQHL